MTSETKSNPLTTLKRLFKPFLEGVNRAEQPDDAVLQSAYEGVTKVAAAMNERARLRALEQEETAKLETLGARLREKDADRILALTEFRVSADTVANDQAQLLLKECAEIRQEMDDAHAVARGIKARIDRLEQELKTLTLLYRGDLGVFLTTIYAGLIDRYNEAAPGVAEIVLQLAAVARVMRTYSAGSFAGWNGSVLMPGMRAGDQSTIKPILDGGSIEFDAEAKERMGGIVAEMHKAGFIYHLD